MLRIVWPVWTLLCFLVVITTYDNRLWPVAFGSFIASALITIAIWVTREKRT